MFSMKASYVNITFITVLILVLAMDIYLLIIVWIENVSEQSHDKKVRESFISM